LVALLSDYDANKHSNLVEYINWVLSELSVGVHKTDESHWSHVHITLK